MLLKPPIKKIILGSPILLALVAYITRKSPRILMYHRFAHSEPAYGEAVAKAQLEWQLDRLKGRWNVISLKDYFFLRKQKKEIPPYTVILTVDDGYADFYEIAYPILREHDIPATFFVATDFIDGDFWLWQDRLLYAILNTRKDEFCVKVNDTLYNYSLDENNRFAIWQRLSDICVNITDSDKWSLISQLERTLNVSVPVAPVSQYQASSWDQIREMKDNGIEIGSHTKTHPVLSMVDEQKLAEEIISSKVIIEEKINQLVSSFCYPNGRDRDITKVVVNLVRQAGYDGAVQGTRINNYSELFRLPRYGITNNRTDFSWKLSGMELLGRSPRF